MKNIFSPEETGNFELVTDFGEAFGQLTRQWVGPKESQLEKGAVQTESKPLGLSEEVTS